MTRLVVPELCNVPAISLLFLLGELLVLVLLFAGGPVTWVRFALMSSFVQWVSISSAGLLCLSRSWLASFGLPQGSVLAFLLVMSVTLIVGLLADSVLSSAAGGGVAWATILGQLVISGIITTLALRYFHVQHQLRVEEQSELQSRIQALQSRIRPHFLFNSMNIIASLIASDPETAESVVEDLSELFRASLNDAGNQVDLQEELDLCERYVRIEALRLGGRLRLEWDIEEPTQIVKIPLLTL
jgi:two-component system sensor histidine kinase AlgZ